MNAFVLVPSISGIASKSFKQRIVNSGTWLSSSDAEGLTNSCLQKRLCHAWSLNIRIGNLFSLSAPTNPSKT